MYSAALLLCLVGTAFALPVIMNGVVFSFQPADQRAAMTRPASIEITMPYGFGLNGFGNPNFPVRQNVEIVPSFGFSNPFMQQYPGRTSIEIMYPYGYAPQVQQPVRAVETHSGGH
uniref:Secreted protein n=1 Tax=Erpetoichthys calabaricus TaxID=27687 RepID=A0A8C4RP52_ERPCA